jgi:hypothetical protein
MHVRILSRSRISIAELPQRGGSLWAGANLFTAESRRFIRKPEKEQEQSATDVFASRKTLNEHQQMGQHIALLADSQ